MIFFQGDHRMNHKEVGAFSVCMICAALFVDGGFWYFLGILWIFFALIAWKMDTGYKVRRR